MADKNKTEAKNDSSTSKKSIPTKKYPLERDVPIGDEVVEKGTAYPLTEKGRKYFKSKNYIK